MRPKKNNPVARFLVLFLVLFALFYYFNILFFKVTISTDPYYIPFLDHYLNYIDWLRWALLHGSAKILKWFGYVTIGNKYELLVVGKGSIRVVYQCLGLGVLSFFAAFVIAYPAALKPKFLFLIAGATGIQVLNLLRFIFVVLLWNWRRNQIMDHHTLFNIFIYIVIAIVLYFWIKADTGEKMQQTT